MNCPNCHCPRGEPLTVATNSLVTRCQHAFHAVSPARPDDFATETAKGTTPPPPSHHGAAEAFVGDLQKSTESTEAARDLPDPQTYKRSDTTLEFPYSTPIPTAHDGSTGWVWCATCESPQPVSGHECVPPGTDEDMHHVGTCLEDADRAEFAESLLCAISLDHGLERFRRHFGGVEGYCHEAEECVFCDAARGGGR